MLRIIAGGALAAMIAVAATGCGGASDAPPVAPVTGTVKVDGEPIEGATVEFIPLEGGRPSMGTTDAAGKYSLTWSPDVNGAAIGKHRVIIRTERAGFSPESDDAGPAVEPRPELLPPQYNTESTLEREVKDESNVMDFDFETGGYKSRVGGGRPDP